VGFVPSIWVAQVHVVIDALFALVTGPLFFALSTLERLREIGLLRPAWWHRSDRPAGRPGPTCSPPSPPARAKRASG
jgi:hypothetical protein